MPSEVSRVERHCLCAETLFSSIVRTVSFLVRRVYSGMTETQSRPPNSKSRLLAVAPAAGGRARALPEFLILRFINVGETPNDEVQA